MKKFRIFVLILCVGLSSCISTNIPKTEKKAKRRLAKHLKGIKDITTTYPKLIDTFTLVIHDTLVIKKHDIDTSFVMVRDTEMVDKLLFDFLAEDSRELRTVERVRTLRNEIIKEVLKDTTFFYEDSLVATTFVIREGQFYYKSVVKERKKAYKTEIINKINTDCDTTKDFWKDYKFWLLLLILLILGIIRNKNNGKT